MKVLQCNDHHYQFTIILNITTTIIQPLCYHLSVHQWWFTTNHRQEEQNDPLPCVLLCLDEFCLRMKGDHQEMIISIAIAAIIIVAVIIIIFIATSPMVTHHGRRYFQKKRGVVVTISNFHLNFYHCENVNELWPNLAGCWIDLSAFGVLVKCL